VHAVAETIEKLKPNRTNELGNERMATLAGMVLETRIGGGRQTRARRNTLAP
jgi:hypothetical protein